MNSRSHSLGDHTEFPLALIAFVCVAIGLLSGISPSRLAGTNWPTQQIVDRVEQIEAPNHANPVAFLDIRFAEELPDKSGDPADPMDVEEADDETDDNETKDYFLRSGLTAFRSQAGLYESPVDPSAQTPFRLRSFPSRGSPSV